jgi:hypothetical protein
MKLPLNKEARVRLIKPVILPGLGTLDAGLFGRTFPMSYHGDRYIEFSQWPGAMFPIGDDDLEVLEYTYASE